MIKKQINNTITLLEKLYAILPKEEFIEACKDVSLLTHETQVLEYTEEMQRFFSDGYNVEQGTIFHYLLCKNRLDILDLLLDEKRITDGLNEKTFVRDRRGESGNQYNAFTYPIKLNNPAIYDLYKKKNISMTNFKDLEYSLSNFTQEYRTNGVLSKEDFKILWNKFLPFAEHFVKHHFSGIVKKKETFIDKFLNCKINPHYKKFLIQAVNHKQYNVLWGFFELYPESKKDLQLNKNLAFEMLLRKNYKGYFDLINIVGPLDLEKEFKTLDEDYQGDSSKALSLGELLNNLKIYCPNETIFFRKDRETYPNIDNVLANQFLTPELLKKYPQYADNMINFALQSQNKVLFDIGMELIKESSPQKEINSILNKKPFAHYIIPQADCKNIQQMYKKYEKITENHPEVFHIFISSLFESTYSLYLDFKKNKYSSQDKDLKKYLNHLLDTCASYYQMHNQLIHTLPVSEDFKNKIESLSLNQITTTVPDKQKPKL